MPADTMRAPTYETIRSLPDRVDGTTTVVPPAAAVRLSLKDSWAYRWRIPCSIASLGLGALLWLLLEPAPVPGTWTDGIMNLAGWLLLLGGLGVRLWATSCLGGRKSCELVDFGPYAICRNPLYWGTLAIAISQVFFFKSICVALGLALPMLIYAYGVVPAEERKLTAALGEAYRRYCRTVPRWLPTMRGARRAVLWKSVATRPFQLELLRAGCWIWLPVIAQAGSRLHG